MSKEYKATDICASCLHQYGLHYYDEEYDFHGCSWDWGCRTCGDDYCDCKEFVLEHTGVFYLQYHTLKDGSYQWVNYEDSKGFTIYEREREAARAYEKVGNMHRNTYNGYGLRLVEETGVDDKGQPILREIYAQTF